MALSFFPFMGRSNRPCLMLIISLLCVGLSFGFSIQAASAMSEINQTDVGEILVENTAGSLYCEIVTHSISQNLKLQAVVWSTGMATGSYSFVVTKQGMSGSSNVAQSGLFEIAPSERKTVGTVMVNASRGDSYLARLLVRAGAEEVICDTKID